jgi:UDP-galactopyranose mutase
VAPARDGAPVEALVVGSHLRWSGVWQRPNHLFARFARRLPVLVVEEPLDAPRDETLTRPTGGLTVLTPHRSRRADYVDDRTIAEVRAWLGGRRAAVWLYSPMLLALADAFPQAPLVYDKMDELAAFRHADARLGAREEALLERAAVVFAGGISLWEGVRSRARRGLALPSGVDFDHFAAARTAQRHTALRSVHGPLFGYVGVIDERLDLDTIARLADGRTEATVVMIGPVAKIDAGTLPQRPNIVYLGQRTYEELPALLAAFDVALMPFALGPATHSISPTKTLEYLAAGLPVVSTAVPDVVRSFADVVHIADAQTFVAAVAAAERAPRAARERGSARAAELSWDGIARTMVDELSDAGIVLPAEP